MNIVLVLLKEKLDSLLRQEADITTKKEETLLTYKNPFGKNPLQVLFSPEEDIKVILNKTPRYYRQDEASIEKLLHDVASYTAGKTVSLDFTDNNGNESRHDRIAKASDVEALTLDSLVELSIRINLLNSVELKYLLASGGTVNVHFWNPANDFRYRQIGSYLKKI
ncbi:MAG: hypothetical protein IKZ43_03455 [Acidaminococcaceae bacterium]|nr:hypothetical protein [Acidaminococcaceae bacterium]